MFDKQKINKIPHVPPRVIQNNSVPETDTDRRPRVNSKKIAHVQKRATTVTGIGKGERKPAEITIPSPLTHFPNGTIIYKLFNKEYWKAKITRYNLTTSYYTVRYNDNDEEHFTHKEINDYLIPPAKGKYWIEQQSGRQRSKMIEKIKLTRGYAGAVRALNPTWYNFHKQSEQEYKHLASTVIDEETGQRLEYRHLIEHPKFKDDWLKSGANEFYQLFQGSKKETDGTQQIKGANTLFWINKEQVPRNKTATYAQVVVDKRPKKGRNTLHQNSSSRRLIRIQRRHKHRNSRPRDSKDGLQQCCKHTGCKIHDS